MAHFVRREVIKSMETWKLIFNMWHSLFDGRGCSQTIQMSFKLILLNAMSEHRDDFSFGGIRLFETNIFFKKNFLSLITRDDIRYDFFVSISQKSSTVVDWARMHTAWDTDLGIFFSSFFFVN